MARELNDIAAEALELPITDRAELATQLLDSLEDLSEEESDALWADEAERRYAEYKAGNIKAVPADEVFARLRARQRFGFSSLQKRRSKRPSLTSTASSPGSVIASSGRSSSRLLSLPNHRASPEAATQQIAAHQYLTARAKPSYTACHTRSRNAFSIRPVRPQIS